MRTLNRRHWTFTALFILAYLVLTATDAASTLLGIRSGLAQESNPHVGEQSGSFDLDRFLCMNGAVLLVLTGMLVWSFRSRDSIDPRYLGRPRLAFWNFIYLNPFAQRNIPRSAFHYIATPICILGMKGLATVNNLLIAKGTPDPITPLAHWIHGIAPGWLAFWMLIFVLWLPCWWPSLAIAAWFLRNGRQTGNAVVSISGSPSP